MDYISDVDSKVTTNQMDLKTLNLPNDFTSFYEYILGRERDA